ncbi:amidase [Ornithinimicrobium cavernae]|uniref:amidase n=1 Tax=Ornithinimicrobium cavernae TaxID=2666047 RepID=UPI000D6A00E5|nr:amidase [Ornithinimicrobium cavernae]
MLDSRTLEEMGDRAGELGLTLISSPDELAQRRAEDEATLESLRTIPPDAGDGDVVPGAVADLRWGGRRTSATPVDTSRAERHASTWITVLDEPRVEPGGPLTGFEVGIKDLMEVEGCTVTAGTRAHRADPAPGDAVAVRALREAGATIRGTTNLHSLAYGATGKSSDWGRPENPAVPGTIPGGSSSGSAAAVADGSAALTLGTDTSGSIRIPASLCGVVGLKPTRGLVSLDGCHPLAPALDHIGPLAPSVAVAAAAMSALAGWRSWQLPEEPLGRVRIGVLGGYFDNGLSAPVRQALGSALERLSGGRAELEEVDLPLARHIPGAQLAVLGTQALESNLTTLRERGRDLPDDVRLRLEAGLARTTEQRRVSLELAARWQRQVDAALERCHVLVSPTTAITATPPETAEVDIDGQPVTVQFSLTRMTMPFNISGHPAISLPVRDGSGAPVGLQLVGRRGGDQDLLAVAAYLEDLLS